MAYIFLLLHERSCMPKQPYVLKGTIERRPVNLVLGDHTAFGKTDVLAILYFSYMHPLANSNPPSDALCVHEEYPDKETIRAFQTMVQQRTKVHDTLDTAAAIFARCSRTHAPSFVRYINSGCVNGLQQAYSDAVYSALTMAAKTGSFSLAIPMLGTNENCKLSVEESAQAMLAGLSRFQESFPDSGLTVTIAVFGDPATFSQNTTFLTLTQVFQTGGFTPNTNPPRNLQQSIQDLREKFQGPT